MRNEISIKFRMYQRKLFAFAVALTFAGQIALAQTSSFTVAPTTPGEAEEIEIRSILRKKNDPVGNYSDIKTAFIAP